MLTFYWTVVYFPAHYENLILGTLLLDTSTFSVVFANLLTLSLKSLITLARCVAELCNMLNTSVLYMSCDESCIIVTSFHFFCYFGFLFVMLCLSCV